MDQIGKIIKSICEQNGLQPIHYASVAGGDINQAFKLKTDKGDYFLKINQANVYPAMFEREAEGLRSLHEKTPIKIPAVIGYGEEENWQWLLIEWLEKASSQPGFWKEFGHGLAMLHQNTNGEFGWKTDNYIGSLPQSNQPNSSWAEFYTHQRIMPLVQQLFEAFAFSKKDVQATELFCRQFENIFPNEPPAFLHGDLWSGNFMVVANGTPALFDPAVYYGHREMDLGMTKLFGGFDNRFYDHYNEIYPMEKDWQKRLPLTQLYPLLVHARLFGGSYIRQCLNIVNGRY